MVAVRRTTTVPSKVIKNDAEPPLKEVGPTESFGKCSISKLISTKDCESYESLLSIVISRVILASLVALAYPEYQKKILKVS